MQAGRQLVDPPAGQTVNNAGSARPRLRQEVGIAGLRLGPHPIEEIGPVEAREVHGRIAQTELSDDVRPDARRCRGGEGEHGNLRMPLPQGGQLAVLRAEIVAPFGNAVRLVDDERVDAGTGAQTAECAIEETSEHEALRRQIHQLVVAPQQAGQATRDLRSADAGVQKGRRNVVVDELAHLVLHEGYQRRHDQAHAGLHQRGQLVAQGLAAAGGHERQHVPAIQHVAHHGFLSGAECVESEGALQCAGQWCGHGAF